jgi:hypothetical protein
MSKATIDRQIDEAVTMRAEYNFAGGVRGKHYHAMQNGYTITVHHEDGSVTRQEVQPHKNTVVLDPDVLAYFPDSETVNNALRTLIKLVPQKPKRVVKRRQHSGA